MKIFPDWFVANETIKKLSTALYADDDILYFNEECGNVVFSCKEIGIFNIDLHDINLIKLLMKMILILLILSYFILSWAFGLVC